MPYKGLINLYRWSQQSGQESHDTGSSLVEALSQWVGDRKVILSYYFFLDLLTSIEVTVSINLITYLLDH